MSHTANGRRVVTISLIFFMVANLIWLGMPFGMAILWSLVDAAHPWSYPDIFPPVLSFSRRASSWASSALRNCSSRQVALIHAVAFSAVESFSSAWSTAAKSASAPA